MNTESAPVGVQLQFERRLAQGRFDLQQCDDCHRHVFHPREICPHCGSDALRWTPASGDGVVHSYTTVAARPEAGGDYNVSLIDLAEGVRMMSRVVDLPPARVRIGMPVRAAVEMLDGVPAVVFREQRA